HFGHSSQSQQAASQPNVPAAPSPAASVVAPADDWESANRAPLLALKAEADRLAAAGELRPALEQYRQLQQRVGEHRPAAADLRRAIAEAKTAEDRVVDQMLHGVTPVASTT